MSDQAPVTIEETLQQGVASSEVTAESEAVESEATAPAQTEETLAAKAKPTTTVPANSASDSMSIDTLRPGQHLVGTVKNITDFGAFVDVGIPQDGLVHISKLAKWKVEKVTDVVEQGQQVDVWVKKVDKKRGRLSLTMIRPIQYRLRDLKEGDELDGNVTRLEPYGAFIDIGSEREGLVHISQISHDYIKHPEEALAVDDRVKVQVLKVDRKKRQVDLSIKALLPPPQEQIEEAAPEIEEVQEIQEDVVEEPALTAMAIAYTALQDKQQTNKTTRKSTNKSKRQQQEEIDAILSRTLAHRG
ncbi:MAG: S1 RNA-binding domain-containing protein [Anaerolineae bacterium]|nr:S1 RNA-binding domain-containing protein [Anaerolineae bacterium]